VRILAGRQWGGHDGLLLGVLDGQGVLAVRVDPTGTLREQSRVPELDGS
jgi:hypothetical protein